MKSRRTIFLSGVSSEFGSFRDSVETEIKMKGCFPENQPHFPPDYCEVEEMLRRKLHDADALIHIVGFRFGAEPNQRPASAPRRSYTQMEFDIARELEKPVYVFVSESDKIRDNPETELQPEDAEATALQIAHRNAVQKTNYLYYSFKDKDQLCRRVAEIVLVRAAGFRADISRITYYAPEELIGRDAELSLLNHAWLKIRRAESSHPRVLTFVALGGEGKTSLVAKWAAELADQNWPACDAAFAWSFYSQGTREQVAASSDVFLKEALTFFGDPAMASSAQSAFEKGRRLAQLVGERRALLILDGLEPLQYAPTSHLRGELKDHGLSALLKGLAATNLGLCVVTTRYSIPDLRAFRQGSSPEVELKRLSQAAGMALLKSLGVKGTRREFETLVEEVQGHALTLNLLGTYLRDAHAGDIRKRDLVKLEEADSEEQGGHAFHVMNAYVRWFESEGEKGRRAIALLRLLGLFDRPANADCLIALLKPPPITDLTEELVGMSEAQRNVAFTRLEDARLLTVNRDAGGALLSLDAHPLLREYFARQLCTQHAEAWRAAHRRLYEHLCETTKEGDQPTLEDLQPLYQAVAHGCQAGMHRETCQKVYRDRIQRGEEAYSTTKLGALGSDLGAIACFYYAPWSHLSPAFMEADQAWLLNEAAFTLRALGRLTEALEPIRAALQMTVKQENWTFAARCGSNLSALELTLGDVTDAVEDAEQSVVYADRSSYVFYQSAFRTTHAEALYHAGHWAQAKALFHEAEKMQAEREPDYPFLYSLQGFRTCDLLLFAHERAAWQLTLDSSSILSTYPLAEACHGVTQRAAQTLTIVERHGRLLDVALDHLTLGRAALYEAILRKSDIQVLKLEIDQAVDGLRRAGTTHHIPRGLLTRAWYRHWTGDTAGAREDLDEAWEIAERGPMRLHMADIHLCRARLFFREQAYPWKSAQADLAAAEALINKCGYHRRDEELADAKRIILGEGI